MSRQRLNVQPQAARAYYCEFALTSRADWRLQRCVGPLLRVSERFKEAFHIGLLSADEANLAAIRI